MKTYNFNNFITYFINKRIQAKKDKKKGMEVCCKIILNASYGKDGMSTAKYSNTKLYHKNKTLFQQSKPNFVATRQITDDLYLVQCSKTSYSISTTLQCSCACLDNAKYWYLNYYYNFMVPCLDMSRLHFIEGDTDSMCWLVAGDSNDGYSQGFKYVIVDKEFYDNNIYKWFPDYSKDLEEEKKLNGLCLEKDGNAMFAIGPKCYYLASSMGGIIKLKGIMKGFNHITGEDYISVLKDKNKVVYSDNITLRMKAVDNSQHKMTKTMQHKIILTSKHNKMRVFANDACAPFVDDLPRDYHKIS
jgi:hypothetical protein